MHVRVWACYLSCRTRCRQICCRKADTFFLNKGVVKANNVLSDIIISHIHLLKESIERKGEGKKRKKQTGQDGVEKLKGSFQCKGSIKLAAAKYFWTVC